MPIGGEEILQRALTLLEVHLPVLLSIDFSHERMRHVYLTSLLFHQAGATFFFTFVDSLRMDTFEGNNKYEGRYMEYLRNLFITKI